MFSDLASTSGPTEPMAGVAPKEAAGTQGIPKGLSLDSKGRSSKCQGGGPFTGVQGELKHREAIVG